MSTHLAPAPLALALALALPAAAQDPPAAAATADPLSGLGATVRSVGFYPHGDLAPLPGERGFTTRFERARAQYIGLQLAFDVAQPATDAVDVPLECTYTRADGHEMGRFQVRVAGEPGATRLFGANANGYAEPGQWPADRYAAACFAGDRTVAEGSFEIVDGPPDVPSLGAKVVRIRFFESGAEAVDPEERAYAVSFDASTLRYLNVELTLRGSEPGPESTTPVACLFIKANGAVYGAVELAAAAPGAEGVSLATRGFGTAAAGSWSPGRYRVACTAEGRYLGDAAVVIR